MRSHTEPSPLPDYPEQHEMADEPLRPGHHGLPRAHRAAPSIVLLLSLLLLAHAAVLFIHSGRAYAGPDAPGYFFSARLLAEDGTAVWRPGSPAAWLVVHYLDDGQGVFRSRYPPGFPLVLAAAYRIGGPVAALAVNPILVLLSVLVLFPPGAKMGGGPPRPARRDAPWDPPGHARARVPGLRPHPRPVPAAPRPPSPRSVARDRPPWPRPRCRILPGSIPAVRYAEIVLGLGVIALFVHRTAERRERFADLAWPVAGALVPFTLLLLYHTAAFGAPLRTGTAQAARRRSSASSTCAGTGSATSGR